MTYYTPPARDPKYDRMALFVIGIIILLFCIWGIVSPHVKP
jgi:uncharacterized membrane protein